MAFSDMERVESMKRICKRYSVAENRLKECIEAEGISVFTFYKWVERYPLCKRWYERACSLRKKIWSTNTLDGTRLNIYKLTEGYEYEEIQKELRPVDKIIQDHNGQDIRKKELELSVLRSTKKVKSPSANTVLRVMSILDSDFRVFNDEQQLDPVDILMPNNEEMQS